MSKTILLADDDPLITQIMSFGMEQTDGDFVIRSTASGEATIEALKEKTPDILVLDIRMPGGDGFTVLEYLQKQKSTVPVVILTNYRNDEYLKRSRDYGVKEYLVKHELKVDGIVRSVRTYLV